MLNLVESLGKDYFIETHAGSCFKHEGKYWYLNNVQLDTKLSTTNNRIYKLICTPLEDIEGIPTTLPADILKNNTPFWETPLGLRAINCLKPGIGRKSAFIKGAYGLEKTIQVGKYLNIITTKSVTELLMPQYAIFREVLDAIREDDTKDFCAILDKNTGFNYNSRSKDGILYLNTGEKVIQVATINKEGEIIRGNETLAFSLINRDRYEPK